MMRRPRYSWRLILASLAAIGWSAAVAEAVPVTFNFRGHVDFVSDTTGRVGSLIRLGDPVSARLRYDTATPDLTEHPNFGRYVGPASLKIHINQLVFKHAGDLDLTVDNDFFFPDGVFDSFLVQASSATPTRWPTELLPLRRGDLLLSWAEERSLAGPDPLPQLFVSDALPVSDTFARVPGQGLIRGFTGPDPDYVVRFTLAPTPEPTTLLLVGTGVAGVGLARWVKRRRSRGHAHESSCVP